MPLMNQISPRAGHASVEEEISLTAGHASVEEDIGGWTRLCGGGHCRLDTPLWRRTLEAGHASVEEDIEGF